jgi:VWFA-related protein
VLARPIHSLRRCCRPALLFLAVLLLSPAISPAQARANTPAAAASGTAKSSATPPFSITSTEISLDLAVRTKHHQPVLNLEPSQLEVIDDGKPVQLTSLRLVNANSASQHLVALVFDPLDARAAKAARRMAAKILAAIPGNGYTFAVLQESGRLRLLQSWTQDRQLVDAAVAQATPATSAPPSGEMTPAEKTLIASLHSDDLSFTAADRTDGKLMLDALEQSQRILEERRSYPSLAALQALVVSDRVLSGRKFIFYFSAGGGFDSDARDILHTIVGLANRAGVTIGVVNTSFYNPRDNSALEASEASSILGEVSPGGGVTAAGSAAGAGAFTPGAVLNSVHSYDIAGFEFGSMGNGQSPLVALADGTGGIYIGGSSAKRQLRELHEDLSSWYQASWVPPIQTYDGQFRAIDIWSSRKHLVIRGPTGYFAVPSTGASAIRPFEMPLLNMLAGPTLPAHIEFHAGVLHLGALPDGNAAELVVQVPVSQLEVREDANTHISSADAAIVAVIKDSRGHVLQHFGQEFPLHEAPEIFGMNSDQMLTLQRQFSAGPGTYMLEAAVLDRIGNKAGAQRTTFTIEAPPRGPSLSDIALVESVEPTDEDDQTFFEPMRYRDGEIVPNLDPFLSEKTRSLSLFFLVHPAAGSANQPTLHMQIFRNGQLLREMPMDLVKVSGTGAAVPCLATIQGRTFPPGAYQVRAVLTQDGATATSQVSFRVEGSIAASNAPIPSLTVAGAGSEKINARVVAEAAAGNSQFVISSPSNPLPSPTDAAIQTAIEGARQRALGWSETLVNFYCLEVTNHFVDATGEGDWRPKGTLMELMKYVDHAESRTTVQVNGEPSGIEPDRLRFFHSTGEFGAMFHVVFDPSAQAVFTWKRSALLDGQPVQVFAFRVARANSTFNLTDRNGHTQPAGFHGLLYLDPATRSVRRISVDADDIPSGLLIRACSLSVDYSWISMGNHDYLLPVRGAVSLQETGRRPVLNQFEFRNYRRFGSEVRMLTAAETKALAKQ